MTGGGLDSLTCLHVCPRDNYFLRIKFLTAMGLWSEQIDYKPLRDRTKYMLYVDLNDFAYLIVRP